MQPQRGLSLFSGAMPAYAGSVEVIVQKNGEYKDYLTHRGEAAMMDWLWHGKGLREAGGLEEQGLSFFCTERTVVSLICTDGRCA